MIARPNIKPAVVAALLAIAGSPVLPAAGLELVVDWLSWSAGGALQDDGGATAANAAIDINSGIMFPGHPQSSVLAGGAWSDPVPIVDSLLGDETVEMIALRVVPQAGPPLYAADFSVTSDRDLVLAVGSLFRDGQSGTPPLEITALTSGGPGPNLEFLGSFSWDNGLTALDGETDWDGANNLLNLIAPDDGESDVSFFRVQADGTSVLGFRVLVAEGYAQGAGDSVLMGVGMVIIPEPALSALLLASLGLFALRRRR